METNRSRNVLVGIAILIIVILVVFFFVRRQTPTLITISSPLPTPFTNYQQDLQNNFGIVVPSGASTANLKSIKGGAETGIATLDKTGSQNAYTIISNLEDPAPGSFYQGWLINGNDYVSLGKLAIAKAGYLVNYSTFKDLSDHKTVWVTMEKVYDATPETHVLEGSF